MEKKYLLCPGYVISQNDGDRHFIGADELARLYGVPMSECSIFDERIQMIRNTDGLIQLHPRSNGDYTRP